VNGPAGICERTGLRGGFITGQKIKKEHYNTTAQELKKRNVWKKVETYIQAVTALGYVTKDSNHKC
jgi:hypothetical protein